MSTTATKPRVPAVDVPRRRFTGLLPSRALIYRAPRWWQELVLTAIGYYLYTKARNFLPNQPVVALRHGRSVEWLQDHLRLNFELSVNHFVARNEWLAQTMDYYYATLHFIVTIGVLVWLFRARPRMYRGLRTSLYATTLFGLAGFFLYPLAPPRLLPGYGYVDTLAVFHTWGSLADPKIAAHTNQFAAMPSLHIAWSLWCAIAICYSVRKWWVRMLGALYPMCTLMVIIGTANHFVIDAAGGVLVVALGFGVQYLLSGRPAHVPAPLGPGIVEEAPVPTEAPAAASSDGSLSGQGATDEDPDQATRPDHSSSTP